MFKYSLHKMFQIPISHKIKSNVSIVFFAGDKNGLSENKKEKKENDWQQNVFADIYRNIMHVLCTNFAEWSGRK